MRFTSVSRRWAAGLTILLLAAAACGDDDGGGGLSIDQDDDAPTATSEEPAAAAEDPDPDDEANLDVGECFAREGGTVGGEVDCTEPHAYEVAAIIDTPFDIVPEDASLQLQRACIEPISDYLGPDTDFGIANSVTSTLPNTPAGESVAGTVDEQTACLSASPQGIDFTGSVADDGLLDAFPEGFAPVATLDLGTCFLLFEDAFSVAELADCSEPDALQHVGLFDFEDPDGTPYPGEDALRARRDPRCRAIAEEFGAERPETASGVFPSDEDWDLGRRLVTCDVEAG